MPRIRSSIFRTDNAQVAKFLVDNFDFTQSGNYLEQKRESGLGTAIELQQDPNFSAVKRNDCYWKMGVLMPDVQRLVKSLQAREVSVGDPAQFRDIGFLVHTTDPDGNTYELLQHTFEWNFKGPHKLNPVTVGQITIRTCKFDETMDFYRRKLGMKVLSVQPVKEFGFCLYFLGYSNEKPPNPINLQAIENREWLWQQAYCTIEIQHVESREIAPFEDLQPGEKGWAGIRVAATKEEAKTLFGSETSTVLRDPNNIPVYIDVE
jgi:catechol 2,3-dioxygenase-like lactoylglutathione lyase family enzyme